MEEQYQALIKNNIWELVLSPCDKKIIWCKWVFKIKRNSDGSIARYKAHLVAKSFYQTLDIYYTKIFSLMAKLVTVRVFLTLILMRGWIVRQLDVNNAFMHSLLTENIFLD